MRQQLAEEKAVYTAKINKNMDRIHEIDTYLQSIYDKENSDFKVFSPRNVETVYKEQIEQSNREKYALEKENQTMFSTVNKYDRYINNLDDVLVCDHNDDLVLKTKMLEIQESDRQRIARDLHDTSLQNLAHLTHMIELSKMYIDKDPVQAKLELESINKNIKDIIDDIRNTVFDLRPMSFDDLGYAEMMGNFVEKLRNRYNRNVELHMDPVSESNRTIVITLYRVIRELCLNAMEHSQCDLLQIQISEDPVNKNINVMIKDNGMGFDVDEVLSKRRNHYGLHIVKERVNMIGGTINIVSDKNEGTRITISVPITEEEKGV